MSPTERTLERLRLWGFSACVVEKFIMQANIRKDAFGFGDILACKDAGEHKGVWLIQASTGSNHAARKKKAQGIAELGLWLRSGGRFAVVTWAVSRGQWVCRWEELKA